jgi:hypothetical protein
MTPVFNLDAYPIPPHPTPPHPARAYLEEMLGRVFGPSTLFLGDKLAAAAKSGGAQRAAAGPAGAAMLHLFAPPRAVH